MFNVPLGLFVSFCVMPIVWLLAVGIFDRIEINRSCKCSKLWDITLCFI